MFNYVYLKKTWIKKSTRGHHMYMYSNTSGGLWDKK